MRVKYFVNQPILYLLFNRLTISAFSTAMYYDFVRATANTWPNMKIWQKNQP